MPYHVLYKTDIIFYPHALYIDFSDFMLSSNGRLVLTALGETQCSDFMVVNDDVREPNETAILTPMVSGDLIHGDVTNFKILINDDGDSELLLYT